MNNIKYTNLIKRNDGWFTYYKCAECHHKLFLDKGEPLPEDCPKCHRIVKNRPERFKADCPICGGKLINHNEGMICDTCDFYIDNEGFGHVEGFED